MRLNRTKKCELIAARTAELTKLAAEENMSTLVYLLEMARVEANNVAVMAMLKSRANRVA